MIRRLTLTGPEVGAAGWRLRPIARVWEVRLPGRHGGLVWLRPIAVEVQDESGREAGRTLTVRDSTRLGQLALLAGGLAALLVVRRRRKRRQDSPTR